MVHVLRLLDTGFFETPPGVGNSADAARKVRAPRFSIMPDDRQSIMYRNNLVYHKSPELLESLMPPCVNDEGGSWGLRNAEVELAALR